MNEEIDIIELLKRVKEGNAPFKIKVYDYEYTYHKNMNGYFRSVIDSNWISFNTDFDVFEMINTKIKILDKPKIEKLTPVKYGNVVTVPDRDVLMDKINEIIDHINKNV